MAQILPHASSLSIATCYLNLPSSSYYTFIARNKNLIKLNLMLYRRVLLKLSGEAFAGEERIGISYERLDYFAQEIISAKETGCEIAVLVGGGNLFRGTELEALGIDRASGDYMGMLATMLNSLALMDKLEQRGITTHLVSSLKMDEVAEPYIRRRCIHHLEKGRLVLLACGLGRPYFSTDTAAVQRALEIGADVVLKATRVKGVFDKDPEKFHDAKFYENITFSQAIENRLEILDITAFTLCKDNSLPLIVFNIFEKGALKRIVSGEKVGTLVS